MSFFSHKKPPQTGQQPAKKREVSMMICPECQHQQSESKIAVSTYCRGCGSHYKISHGIAATDSKIPNNPFAGKKSVNAKADEPVDRGTSDEHIVTAATTATEANQLDGEKGEHRETQKSSEQNPTQEATSLTSDLRSQLSQKASSAGSFFQRKNKRRKLLCLKCDHEHEAPADASSTLCSACGAYVSLKNYIINNHWNRRIETRGNVTIQKKGSVTDITVRCHDILVLGTLKGGIDCSGDITLNSHSKIMGNVSCRRLVIDKRADVAFANEVVCEEAIIDGHVTGHFVCTGKLHLKKKAVLNGNIVVANMTIDKGARHNGKISIQQ